MAEIVLVHNDAEYNALQSGQQLKINGVEHTLVSRNAEITTFHREFLGTTVELGVWGYQFKDGEKSEPGQVYAFGYSIKNLGKIGAAA